MSKSEQESKMGFQEMIDKLCEGEMYKRVATGQNMSLGQLINALREVEGNTPDGKTKEVRLENGLSFTDVGSYRGYYSDLAIEPAGEGEAPITVLDLLVILNRAVRATFTGYKGGEYRMELHTPVWVSEYGSASGLAVKGVEVREGKAIILTEQVD
jgi:hypothetical protein